MAEKIEIRWSRDARRDLREVIAWIQPRDPAAARRLAQRILEATDLLETAPEMGAVVEDLEPVGAYRQIVIRRYRIIYRLVGARVWVLRVWDSRRNPADLSVP